MTAQFMTANKMAKETGIPAIQIRRRIKKGTAPGYYVGNRFYCDVAAFIELLHRESEIANGKIVDDKA